MTLNREEERELWNFLAAIFHQDIVSPEQALEEYVEEEIPQYVRELIGIISKYLDSDIPEQDKNRYIEKATFIYFPAIGLTPVQWLQSVRDRLEQAVSSDRG